ncbi:NAD(P)H-binding [Pelagirhabdus alkalitolerans]|uniref:NAD(P)H-binding n=1 Tax=Pelagirhabdus alkalitolerans TaxID=1612202 RepID=A0A1G6MQY7_9BACI|nr:SDR family oxidoreductase [Pelagirhabdus alkalitolerans]SDC57973.1 NAD(P)H-binding [Pelagirhabdus alkalitolerans]
MKVLVIGANGQIGKHLVKMIQDTSDMTAKAMIRKEEQKDYFEKLGAETAVVDLESSIESIQAATEDVDAVVFTAGSGPNTGKDKTIMVDLDGAVKTIEAAKKAGVKRYVMVSSFDTTREEIQRAPEGFAPYVVAKHYADDWLRKADMDYTIVHPGGLTNDDGTGKVTLKEKTDRGNVPREDIAHVLLETLQKPSTIGKEFQVIEGDQTISESLDQIK